MRQLPLTDKDVQELILEYAQTHASFTEEEVGTYIQCYEEMVIAILTYNMAKQGKLKTGRRGGEVVFLSHDAPSLATAD